MRSGYRERAADAAERRIRDDEPPACPTPQAVDIVAARLDEAAKGRSQEQQKRERAQREADAARARAELARRSSEHAAALSAAAGRVQAVRTAAVFAALLVVCQFLLLNQELASFEALQRY